MRAQRKRENGKGEWKQVDITTLRPPEPDSEETDGMDPRSTSFIFPIPISISLLSSCFPVPDDLSSSLLSPLLPSVISVVAFLSLLVHQSMYLLRSCFWAKSTKRAST